MIVRPSPSIPCCHPPLLRYGVRLLNLHPLQHPAPRLLHLAEGPQRRLRVARPLVDVGQQGQKLRLVHTLFVCSLLSANVPATHPCTHLHDDRVQFVVLSLPLDRLLHRPLRLLVLLQPHLQLGQVVAQRRVVLALHGLLVVVDGLAVLWVWGRGCCGVGTLVRYAGDLPGACAEGPDPSWRPAENPSGYASPPGRWYNKGHGIQELQLDKISFDFSSATTAYRRKKRDI